MCHVYPHQVLGRSPTPCTSVVQVNGLYIAHEVRDRPRELSCERCGASAGCRGCHRQDHRWACGLDGHAGRWFHRALMAADREAERGLEPLASDLRLRARSIDLVQVRGQRQLETVAHGHHDGKGDGEPCRDADRHRTWPPCGHGDRRTERGPLRRWSRHR